MVEDRYVQQAVERAMSGPSMVQQHQAAAQVIIQAADLAKFVEVGVLTRKQVFDVMFKGQMPTEFLGKD